MDAIAKKYGKIPEISDINANASIIDEVRAMQLCLLKSDEWKNELHGRLTTMLNGSAIKNWMHHSTAKLHNHIFPENVEGISIASSHNGGKIDVDGTEKVSATSNSDMMMEECLDDGTSNRQVEATMDRTLVAIDPMHIKGRNEKEMVTNERTLTVQNELDIATTENVQVANTEQIETASIEAPAKKIQNHVDEEVTDRLDDDSDSHSHDSSIKPKEKTVKLEERREKGDHQKSMQAEQDRTLLLQDTIRLANLGHARLKGKSNLCMIVMCDILFL